MCLWHSVTWLAFLHSSDGKRVLFFFERRRKFGRKTLRGKLFHTKVFVEWGKWCFCIPFVTSDVTCHFWKPSLFPPGASVWLRRKVPQHTRSSGLTDLLPVLTFLVREQRNDSKTEALAGRLQIIRVPPSTCSRPLWRSLWANGGGSLLWLLHRAAFFSPPFFSFSVRSLPSLFCSISSGASVCDQIPDKTNEIPLSLRCSLWLRLV